MDVSKYRGTPKWDGLQWKPYEQMDDLGYHYFWKHPYTTKQINMKPQHSPVERETLLQNQPFLGFHRIW